MRRKRHHTHGPLCCYNLYMQVTIVSHTCAATYYSTRVDNYGRIVTQTRRRSDLKTELASRRRQCSATEANAHLHTIYSYERSCMLYGCTLYMYIPVCATKGQPIIVMPPQSSQTILRSTPVQLYCTSVQCTLYYCGPPYR